MLEISLIENLQRKDLTPFEEAAALQRLCDQFRYTHDEIARKLGKSRTVVTETLSLNRMPEDDPGAMSAGRHRQQVDAAPDRAPGDARRRCTGWSTGSPATG